MWFEQLQQAYITILQSDQEIDLSTTGHFAFKEFKGVV